MPIRVSRDHAHIGDGLDMPREARAGIADKTPCATLTVEQRRGCRPRFVGIAKDMHDHGGRESVIYSQPNPTSAPSEQYRRNYEAIDWTA
jgi:hypothetical protein